MNMNINLTPIIGAVSPQAPLSNLGYQTPIMGLTDGSGSQPQLLRNLASIQHISTPVIVSHYNVQPVFDIYANTQDSDLGSVARQVQKIVDDVKQHLPRGTTVLMRGQVQT